MLAETYFKDALKRLQAIERQPNIPETWEPLLNNLGHTSRKLKYARQPILESIIQIANFLNFKRKNRLL